MCDGQRFTSEKSWLDILVGEDPLKIQLKHPKPSLVTVGAIQLCPWMFDATISIYIHPILAAGCMLC